MLLQRFLRVRHMNRFLALVVVLVLVVAGGVSFYIYESSRYKPSTTGFLKPGNLELVAQGEMIYKQSCAACHGDNLQGQANWRSPDGDGYLPAPPHDETGHTWHHRDELLFELTKFGTAAFGGENFKSRMPQFDGVLTDEEIIAVLSYIKSTWPEEIQKRHDILDAQPR